MPPSGILYWQHLYFRAILSSWLLISSRWRRLGWPQAITQRRHRSVDDLVATEGLVTLPEQGLCIRVVR